MNIIKEKIEDCFVSFNNLSNNNISFRNKENKEIGKLIFDDDICEFEGNASESAKIFFDTVILQYMNFNNN